ncbi:MAG: Mfa1 family fimbria major subunit [Prevotellaceae bacterium]|nr:Mfa1 family fimbria major subunit [Prevotellaceae bacterium]
MKLKSYFLSMLALAALGSCSSDDSASDSADSGALEGNSYMAVNLVMSSGSDHVRATDASPSTAGGYVNGTPEENTVNPTNSIFLFYDRYGNYLTSGTITSGENIVPTVSNADNPNSTIPTAATIILGPTTSTPAKVLAILNVGDDADGNDIKQKFINKDLSTVTDIMTSTDLPSAAGSFVMSNSVYLDTENSEISYGQNIEANNICTTSEAALAAPVAIYVERAVAKAVIGVAESASKYDATSDENGKYYFDLDDPYLYNNGTASSNVYFRIVVDGMAINATNSSTRIVKYLKDEWTTTSRPWRGWNNYSDKRSYWAVDKNYEITDNEYLTGVEYKSWNNVVAGTTKTDGLYTYNNTSGYYHENTVSNAASDASKDGGETAATPNLMVAAHIEISTDNGSTYNEIPGTGSAGNIYRVGGTFYTYDGVKNNIASNANDKGYRWRTGEEGNYSYEEMTSSDLDCTFEVLTNDDEIWSSLSTTVQGTIGIVKVASVTNNKSGATLVKKNDSDGYDVVTDDLATLINKGDVITAGLECFAGGACYYQKPIDHPTENIVAYGFVRNHVYDLTINSISGVGGAVPDKNGEQDVIPGEHENYYIAATLNVLSWRTVTQTFDF